MTGWMVVAVVGLGTYAARLSSIAVLSRTGVPGWLRLPLRFVAPAVLAALVAGEVLVDDTGGFALVTAPVVAAALAGLTAWRARNLAIPIVVGMAALWLLEAL